MPRFGHIVSDCPNCKIVSLVKEDVGNGEEDLGEPMHDGGVDDEKEIVYADQGESLVVCRSLSAAHV